MRATALVMTRKTPAPPGGVLARLKPRKLRTRLFLLLSLLITAIAGFIILYFPARLEIRTLEQMGEKIGYLTRLTAGNLSGLLAAADTDGLNDVLAALADSHPAMAYGVLEDVSGRVAGARDLAAAERASYRGTDPLHPVSPNGEIFRAWAPVAAGGGAGGGALYLGFRLKDLLSGVRMERRTTTLVSAAVLLAGLLLAFSISTLVLTPLSRITRSAEVIAKGDLKHRARVEAPDEFGRLAESFNTMVDSLDGAYRQLQDLNRSLEQRVKLRAADLEREIAERRRMERELRLIREELERRVEHRTEELASTNDELHDQVLETRRAEDKLQDMLTKLRKALEGTVQAMSMTIEMRDMYTAGHQRRVTNLAVALAKEMHLTADKIEGLRMAGVLHDLGKISVPAEILTKPSRLSRTEFQLIKEHPRVGFDILKRIEFPWPVAHIVLQHHERMDGSGYPDGLAGDAILLEARILAVADVVEALSSHRPYRPAIGLQKALEEIRRGRGTIYDATVVDACLRLFKERSYSLNDLDPNGVN